MKVAPTQRRVKAMWRLDIDDRNPYVFACERPVRDRAGRSCIVRAWTTGRALSRALPSLKDLWRSRVPNIASAKKDMRKSHAAMIRNRAQRSALRTALKKAKAPGASPADREAAVRLLDRAARKGLIHRNSAARHKSTMAKS
jgi:small subunit ribosomal protein S20